MIGNFENIERQLSEAGYTLYPHQQEGIQWMLERERVSNGGFLCDDPGLGKTLQILSLIAGNSKGGRNLII